MSAKHSHRTLRAENLEQRQLFAGDVFASVSNGTLHLAEANGSFGLPQAVEISRPAFDLTGTTIRVTGLPNATGSTTLINGMKYRDFQVSTKNVNVNLASGDDIVVIKNAPINNLNVDTGDGRDSVIFDRSKTTGLVTVRTGADNDFVNLFESQIGNDSLDNLNVYMDTGADIFYSKNLNNLATVSGNLNLYMSQNELDRDVDTITLEKATVRGVLNMRTGAGDDVVSVNRVVVGNDVLLNTGADADTAKLIEVQAIDDIWAYMGSGNDTLELDDVWADRLEVYGDSDFDTLIKRRTGQYNFFQALGFERSTI